MNDNQIIHLFFARNEEAIRQTETKYGRRLTVLSENIVRNAEDAEECVSDTYRKAWETIPPTEPEHYYAYLAKICRHFSLGKLDWNHAAKRNAEIVALTQEMEACIPAVQANDRELSRIISEFLKEQPKENRIIFVRRYWYTDSLSQIAERFGISEQAAAMRLRRTRLKLADYLQKEGITL